MKFENYRAKKQRRMVVMLSSSWLLDLAEVGRGVLGLRASSRTTWVECFDFQLHPCLWHVIHANKICLHCLSAILSFKFSMHLVTEDSPWRGYATWNDLKMNKLLGDSFFLSTKWPICHSVVTPLDCKRKKKYLEGQKRQVLHL